ncbi:MAG: hypothetical protein GYA33_06065 [Thermogutta sp.]|nr:hypothetical protein [Thermogutta sp.]
MATLGVLWATVMIPLAAHGGFVCDDWMVLSHAAEHPTWWADYRSWFPLFAARPLAPVLLATTSTLLPGLPAAYIVIHLLLLGSAMAIVGLIWRRFFGLGAAAGFFILATFPSVASTLVFSPGMQQLASAAYLIWAISMYLTVAAAEANPLRRRIGLATAAAVLLLLGLILYEIFLPLLLIQWAVPLAIRLEKAESNRGESARTFASVSRRDAAFWAVMIAVPVVIAAILQKWVFPAFAPDMSRLQFGGPGMAIRAVAYWFTAVLVQLPLLWADGISRLTQGWDWLTLTAAAAFLVALFYYLRSCLYEARPGDSFGQAACLHEPASRRGCEPDQAARLLRITCWVAAGSSIFLFVLSNAYAAVFGYDNRKLSSFWTACALAVSAYLGRNPSAFCRGGITSGGVIFFCVFILNTTSFLIQRNNYLLSWHMQQTILEDLASSLPPDHGRPITVLAAVPPVVPGNYNDECVFTRPWDIGNAARMRTGGRIRDAAPIYPWLIRQDRVRFSSDAVTIDDLWTAKYEEGFWLFGWRPAGAKVRPMTGRFLGMPLLPAYRYRKPDAVMTWIPIDSQERLQSALSDWFAHQGHEEEMSRSAVVTQTAAEWFRERFLGKPANDCRKGTEKPRERGR